MVPGQLVEAAYEDRELGCATITRLGAGQPVNGTR